jgi:hypothetical protein
VASTCERIDLAVKPLKKTDQLSSKRAAYWLADANPAHAAPFWAQAREAGIKNPAEAGILMGLWAGVLVCPVKAGATGACTS